MSRFHLRITRLRSCLSLWCAVVAVLAATPISAAPLAGNVEQVLQAKTATDDSTELVWIDCPAPLINSAAYLAADADDYPPRWPPDYDLVRLTAEPVPLAQPLTLETGTHEYGLNMPPVKKEGTQRCRSSRGGEPSPPRT